jgi:tRNA-uridine 2-sulfurtransferase
LGIPLHTINFEKEYKSTVLDYFFKEYSAGRTPNPDVMCNKEIKFKLLYKWALAHRFDYVATGHYARVAQSKKYKNENLHLKISSEQGRVNAKKLSRQSVLSINKQSRYQLLRSKDEFKDQTYFIYNIIPNADKKESMGVCFVGKIRLKEFLEQKLKPKPGPVVDLLGKRIGEHQGLAYYTIGQRQGIGVGSGGPWFVVRKDLKSNTLVVTNNPKDKALETKAIEIHSVNWITTPLFPKEKNRIAGVKLKGRFRHQGHLESVIIKPLPRGHYSVEFFKPQSAIASGQSLVLYDGQVCVGGGVIV